MTIIVSNAVLGVDNRISVNSSSNSFVFAVGSSTHESNSSSLKINTTTVNSSGVYVSGSPRRGEAGDVVFVNSSAPAPNGFLVSNTTYFISEKPKYFGVYGHRTTLWRNTQSNTIEDLRGVTYGNGVYVAIGEAGTVRSSTDAITWDSRTLPQTNSQVGIIYDDVNGLFISVGSGPTVFTSTDAFTWTSRSGGTAGALWSIAYSNGIYVATGTGGVSQQVIQSSTDLITWTNRFAGVVSSGTIRDVTYGNGIFVAVGTSGFIRSSTDGITWTARTAANTSTSFYSVVYADGIFVATGGDTGSTLGSIQTSTNGITWTNRTPVATSGSNTILTSVTYGNGQFVVTGLALNAGVARVGSGNVQTSSDGITWTQRPAASNSFLWGSGYGNGIYLIAGESGSLQTIAANYGTQFTTPNITAPNNTIAYVRER